MDARTFFVACLATTPLVCLADSGSNHGGITPLPPHSAEIQQPNWIKPGKTVRLARVPNSTDNVEAEKDDIGELLGGEIREPLPLPLPKDRKQDRSVVRASANLPFGNPRRAQDLLDQARTLAEQSTELADFERVLDLCHAAVEAGPTPNQADSLAKFGAWAANGRGECLLALGNEHGAFEAFQEALKLDPTCWEALHNRAVTLAANGRPREALNDFTQVIRLAPTFGSAFRNRGELYASRGELTLALGDFSQAIALEPDNGTHHYSRALVQRQLGQLAETVKDLNAAVQLTDDWDKPLVVRGDIYQSLGYWEKSIEDYRNALEANPRCLPAYKGLAWLLATCPNYRYRNSDTAIEAAHRAERLGDANDWKLLDIVAAAHASAGEFDRATSLVTQAIVIAGDEASGELQGRLKLYRQRKPFRLDIKP